MMTNFPFIGRTKELAQLERWHAEGRTHFIVLHGKRRVGKTALARRFLAGKGGIYYMADRTSANDQIKLFSELVGQHFQDEFLLSRGFGSWLEAFRYLKGRARGLVLVIDEFPYLVESDPALSSVFQKGFDEHWHDSGIFLILTGSSIGMMETEVLGVKAPLYGRRTGQIRLDMLPFASARLFYPTWGPEDALRAFGTLGGTPAYLLQFSAARSYKENVLQAMLSTNTYLFEEPDFLLREELREPRNYFAILRALALGKAKLSEIQNETGFERSTLSKYISILQSLRMVERLVPVTERQPEKSKRGHYRITDPFLRFWFAFIFPNRNYLEQELLDFVWEQRIAPRLDQFLGTTFEDVCMSYLREVGYRQHPYVLEHLGRFWDRETEVDMVAFDDARNHLLLAECKWSRNAVGIDVLDSLKSKTLAVTRELGYTPSTIRHAIFSRSGFSKELQALKGEVTLIGLEQMTQPE